MPRLPRLEVKGREVMAQSHAPAEQILADPSALRERVASAAQVKVLPDAAEERRRAHDRPGFHSHTVRSDRRPRVPRYVSKQIRYD